MPNHEIIVGLDVGTAKVHCLIGEMSDKGELTITGVGVAPSVGLDKGIVTDIEATVAAIDHAVTEARLMAGVTINGACITVSGAHVKGLNSHGVLAIKHAEINQDDIDAVLDQAQAVAMPPDRIHLHTLVQEFIVDQQDGIKVPLGMNGIRLEVKAFLVNASRGATENVIKCAQKVGLVVPTAVLAPLASALSVLTEDERKLGVALVDIGAGTSDIIVYYKDAVVYTAAVPFGGSNITRDIAMGLRTPTLMAEDLKRKAGTAIPALVNKDETIEVIKVGGNEKAVHSRKNLCGIIEARTEEILNRIDEEIKNSQYQDLLGAGIVLTGGVVNMPGVLEKADEIFGVPVRRGVPRNVKGYQEMVQTPEFATAVGALLHGQQLAQERRRRNADRDEPWWKRVLNLVINNDAR